MQTFETKESMSYMHMSIAFYIVITNAVYFD